jgi:hypothetical protein
MLAATLWPAGRPTRQYKWWMHESIFEKRAKSPRSGTLRFLQNNIVREFETGQAREIPVTVADL